jgi:hypothetical protein
MLTSMLTSRYTGYWWSEKGDKILYQIVDEADVESIYMSRYALYVIILQI